MCTRGRTWPDSAIRFARSWRSKIALYATHCLPLEVHAYGRVSGGQASCRQHHFLTGVPSMRMVSGAHTCRNRRCSASKSYRYSSLVSGQCKKLSCARCTLPWLIPDGCLGLCLADCKGLHPMQIYNTRLSNRYHDVRGSSPSQCTDHSTRLAGLPLCASSGIAHTACHHVCTPVGWA